MDEQANGRGRVCSHCLRGNHANCNGPSGFWGACHCQHATAGDVKPEVLDIVWGDRNGERCGGCRDLGPHTFNSACEYQPTPEPDDQEKETP